MWSRLLGGMIQDRRRKFCHGEYSLVHERCYISAVGAPDFPSRSGVCVAGMPDLEPLYVRWKENSPQAANIPNNLVRWIKCAHEQIHIILDPKSACDWPNLLPWYFDPRAGGQSPGYVLIRYLPKPNAAPYNPSSPRANLRSDRGISSRKFQLTF